MKKQSAAVEYGRKTNTYQLCAVALMAAVICILGPLSIPIGPVPITLATFFIYLTVFVLGTKLGTMSCLLYLLLGLAGLPVFSGYTGGLAKLAGPTGGYLLGYIFIALIGGYILEKSTRKIFWSFLGMVLGTAAAYLLGTAWFVVLMKCSLSYALTVCVLPFIIGDLAKIAAALLLGRELRKRLLAAGLEIKEDNAKLLL